MTRRALVLVGVLMLALTAVASADWDVGQPHKWVQYPDLETTGMDVNASFPYILADDFLCTEPGPILGIHLWGSWMNDHLPFGTDPRAVSFIFSIHEDIPDSMNPLGYSMPGDVLWTIQVPAGAFNARIWAENLQEGWYDPPYNYDPLGDTICWQYNFLFDPSSAFIQEGTPTDPIVYWLDVQAIPNDPESYFGWKTSIDHWNDDAAWVQGSEPYSGVWNEMRYPNGHPWFPESVDLAFVLTGEDSSSDVLDFGDAPDPSYPTLIASGGAVHVIVPGFQMGAMIDGEPDGQPNPGATGDDIGGVDDEDGVTFTTAMIPGNSAEVTIDMIASAVGGLIDAWVDFGGDGGWTEAGDQILTSVPAAGGVITTMTFNVPGSAIPGTTFARVRLSTGGGLSDGGGAANGEVEDYEVRIDAEEWKWIQTPDLEDTGIDVNCTEPSILADDFFCDEPGRLTYIQVWGSWLNDYLPFYSDPEAVKFTLSIHADIPEIPGVTHSMPGEILWLRDFIPGEFTVEIWKDQIQEGWLFPPDEYYFPADTVCWLYSFTIPHEEAFHQVGTPDSGIVYWLDVQAIPNDVDALFGWKTSLDHWNDDGVWGVGFEPYVGPWEELIYPSMHELYGQSIDLAFAIRMEYGTGVPDEIISERDNLRQNVPNPFNPKTTIQYEVPAGGGHVTIEIYDVTGRLVSTLVDGFEPEGERSVVWDGTDSDGQKMATGVYFYHMRAEGIESSRKMLLLK